MSLAVYIGTEKFQHEPRGEAQAQPANAVTLDDLVSGHDNHNREGQPSWLLLSSFTEAALSKLEHWLNADAERTCTLAWPHPSAWLAANLQQANRPKEALWQWSYQADLILKLYKRKRRQIILEGYLPGAPAAGSLPLVAELSLADISPIYRLMAHQLTQEDNLFQQSFNYLKASSAFVATWQLPAVETVEQSLHYLAEEHQQRDGLKAATEAAQTKLDDAQQHISQLNEQLEARHHQLQEAQQKQTALQQQVKETAERLSEKNAQLLETQKSKDEQHAQLQQQINEHQKAYEQQLQQFSEQQKAHEQLNKKLTEQQKAHETQAREHAKLQDHAHSTEQENAALLEQLMKVQEALEENILAKQAQQTTLDEKEVKLNWLRKKTKNQDAKLEEHKTAFSQLKAEHKKALAALETALQQQKQEAKQKEQELITAHKGALKLAEQQAAEAKKKEQQLIQAHQTALMQAEQYAQQQQEKLLQEQALLAEQLHNTQEQLNQEQAKKQAALQEKAQLESQLEKQSRAAEQQAAQNAQRLEQEAQERALLTEQLHETQEQLVKSSQAAQQAQAKLKQQLEKQSRAAEQQAAQNAQRLEQEAQERALLTEQLHETQEQLVKNTEDALHYQKQAENRQKTINMLKQEQQVERHQYESITQWLKANGHRNAAAAYRYSRPFKRALPQQVAMLKQSPFFDAQWYCDQYPDVKTSGIEPAEHYIKFGATEGRNPSDQFDTCYYLCEYPDVAVSGQNPLLHYLRYGQHEERLPARPRQKLPAPTGNQ